MMTIAVAIKAAAAKLGMRVNPAMAVSNPNITKDQLRIATSLGKGTIDRAIKMLKEKGFIERVGSNKSGYWKIV